MKKPCTVPLFFSLTCLFVLCFLACGSGEDSENEPTYAELREENPELWAQLEREHLIEEHGDNPHTHTVAEFHRKEALGLQTTEDDYLAYLEAEVHLNPDDEIGKQLLERFQKAKVDGIPFKDVKVDDILPSKEEDNE